MYIKLNTIRLQYTKEVNDIFILAEVPDSTMSYEKPVIVRTVDELESWFGKWFTSYDYFVELLERNISLYLYKPISPDKIKDEQYIDLSTYTMDPQIYPTKESLLLIDDPSPSTKYWVGGLYVDWDNLVDGGEVESLPQNPNPGTKYLMNDIWYTCVNKQWISSRDSIGCFYIWLWDSWVSEKALPQNTEVTSISQENRDTLLLSIPSYEYTTTHCHPEYHESRLGVFSGDYDYSSLEFNPDEPISLGDSIESTYVYKLGFQGSLPNYFYLVLPDPVYPDIYFLIYNDADWDHLDYGGEVEDLPQEPDPTKKYMWNGSYWAFYGSSWLCEDNRVENKVPISFIPMDDNQHERTLRRRVDTTWEDVKNEISTFYPYENVIDSGGEEIIFYSTHAVPVDDYYNFPDLTVSTSFRDSQNLITTNLGEQFWNVEVWSKTIGRADPDYEDDLITLQIEELKAGEEYRFTVSRLSYSEIFEGKLHPGKGEERLDYIISRDSKLVHVRFDNITDGLRTGTWKLRGATAESYNPDMYWRGLEAMFTTDSIHPDYILVPKKENWTSDISNPDYLEKFLSVCTSYSCQALIQNNLSEYMVKEVSVKPKWSEELEDYILWLVNGQYWRKGERALIEETDRITIETSQNLGDFIYNLKGDQDNRLVYFFQGMTVYGRQRPGYYLYLLGLFNDIYSASSSVINYNNFVDNPYVDEEFEETLKSYKSNYLVGNNQIFYYKDYQNGNPYTSTGWMRFAIGKITRELQRNRSAYLGKRNSVEIERGIKEVLNNIVRRFSIIDQIEILNFQVSNSENRINLHLETKVKDLVDNNIGLDITINYNE